MESPVWTSVLLLQSHVSPPAGCLSQLPSRHYLTRVTRARPNFLSGYTAGRTLNAYSDFYAGVVLNYLGVFFT